MDHWPIFKPAYYLAPFPPFFASFFTSFTYFLGAGFFGSTAAGEAMLLAASNFVCLSLSTFTSNSFLKSSLLKSNRQ